MNRFKVGDIVMCMETISPHVNGPEAGVMYTVLSVNDKDPTYQSIGVFCPKCIYDEETKLGKHANWGSNAFRIICENSYKPQTESDHLDKIQNNFKEGV